ncbi:TPA: hypothetical protein IAB29_02780 [Candidatus Ventrenecus stercoripullorum]|nr:hypothetical protein [Candidatus Ventrenecus stercoripullorum]
MISKPWVTKEGLNLELTGKSIEEQKKIIRRVLQENAYKYKNELKDKKMPVAQVDDYELEKLEEEINFFLEQQDTSAIEKYEFINRVKAGILSFSADEKELMEALCMIDMPEKRPFYMDYLIKHISAWLNRDCIEFIGGFFSLWPQEQEALIPLLPKLYQQEKTLTVKNQLLTISPEAIKSIMIFITLNLETQKALVDHLEIFNYLSLEIERDREFMSFIILYKILKETKISGTLENKCVEDMQYQVKEKFDPVLQSLSQEASVQRSQKFLHEKLLEIIQALKQEPKKYISVSLEQLEKLPMNFLMDIVNVVMDNNTVAYINLFKKEKEKTIPKTSMSKEELEALSYLKKYYKNGEIINIPENIEKFTEALKRIHRTEDEIRCLLNQVNTLLEKEREILPLEEVVIVPEIEEPQENELVYLKSDIGNYYALKDLDDIPKEYYASFLELLLSIKNNRFKNRKNLTDISKVLEVKNFKTRIIFSRVGQTKYAILGMFMKKVDKDKLQRKFLLARQDQFLRQVETLKNTENETEITELLLAKLNQNEDTLDMSLNRTKKED